MTNDGLVPKVITDKNGTRRTVYVSQDSSTASNIERLKGIDVESAIRSIEQVHTTDRIEEFLNETELGDQFDRDSWTLSDDGRRFQATVEDGFQYRGDTYSPGDLVTMDSRSMEIVSE